MTDPAIVIFDIGEVLVTPTGLMDRLARRVGCDATRFAVAYWKRRLEYDLGLDAFEYWIDILDGLAVVANLSTVQDLIRIDTLGWTTIRPDAARLLERLHESGMRVGVLSNATVEMGEALREGPWSHLIDDWFFSFELGIAKPNPAVFLRVADALGLPASQISYVEDSQASVKAALDAGWTAHLWRSQSEAEAHLAPFYRHHPSAGEGGD
jgi:putative hydrolase of the HAD superfamily